MSSTPTPDLSRRSLLAGATGTGVLGLSAALLSACGESSGSAASGGATKTLKIGYISPATGFATGLDDVDPYLIEQFTKALVGGVTVDGTSYRVQFVLKDSKSEPHSAAQAATELIASGVDLLLASSTPETVNPVADAAEAAGVPCLSTACLWEAFYFGRGATVDKPFTYTYHFFIGVEELAKVYESLWLRGVENNKVLGVLWPNDADGNAIRGGMTPLLTKAGITIVDPGAFPGGTLDFTSIISKFQAADVQVINSLAAPPDFATFWKQAAQQGFRPRIATIASTGLLPSQVEALGDLGPGLTAGVYWHPTWPTKSAILGMTSQQLADGYEAASGKQWTQNLGTTAALFEAAVTALKTSTDPKDRQAVATALEKLTVDTTVGTLNWTKGPVKNVAVEPLVGGKWVRNTSGTYPVTMQIVENSGYPQLAVQAKDTPLP
jgi:branched-chain amino acid transport system substrate-binding protein